MINVYQEFKQIPKEKLTSISCLNFIKRDPRIVTVMPKELINEEIFPSKNFEISKRKLSILL